MCLYACVTVIGASACSTNEVEVSFVRQYGNSNAPEESFSLYKGTSSSGTLILSKQGTEADNDMLISYPICIELNQSYYIEFNDSSNNGWNGNSYVHILYEDNSIYQGRLTSGNFNSDTFIYSTNSCSSNEIEATLIRKYGYNYASEELFKLYKGTSSNGILILSKQGISINDNKQYSYSICIERDQSYYVEYHVAGNNGWDSNSYIQVMNGDITIYQGRLVSGNLSTDTFNYPSCQSTEVEAILMRQYGGNAVEELFSIYKGTTSNDPLLMSKQGMSINNNKQYMHSICIEPNQSYYIEYNDSGNNGWDSNSYIQIVNGDITIFDGKLSIGSSGSATFNYPSCQSTEVEAILIRQYSTNSNQELFRLYKGTSSNDPLLMSRQGTNSNINKLYKYSICIERDQSYYIQYQDSGSNGWDSSSYVQIMNGGNTIFNGRLASGSSGYDIFTTTSMFSTPQTQWKYSDFPQFNKEWTKSSFNDNSWSTATTGSFPSFTSTTRYYRFTGTVSNRDSISTLYSFINNRYGFVLYIEGTEIYRYHMPSGSISFMTPATESDGTYYVSVSANKFALPQSGPFVIAYEVQLP